METIHECSYCENTTNGLQKSYWIGKWKVYYSFKCFLCHNVSHFFILKITKRCSRSSPSSR